ncbi:female protein-like [Hippoglossus stenolepis]|uniref:female protein-like n=1 Tax=Hippoglossus stenolepis TaxID=195615 RepID=UPI00159CA178|nr:female protein-like [Hippoglossus stenolepis]
MILLLGLVMLTGCAESIEDMSGRMFLFPQQSNTARVKLNTAQQDLSAVTLCHRSFTDLNRDHALFSLATSSKSNDFLIFWDEANKEMEPHIRDKKAEYRGFDYRPNMWHSICTTWDAESGLVQMWFDGIPSIRRSTSSGSHIQGTMMIILGQEQDSHGGGFDIKQSFVGMMSDVHMWDHILSSCEIQNYVNEDKITPGNVINWNALDFQIFNNVLIEQKSKSCH